MSEKFILTRQMHLGFAKDTFERGAVIEFIPERNILVIDGRTFHDTRDIEILKRRSQTRPDAPWIVPFSPEALQAIKGVPAFPEAAQPPERRSDGRLPIVQSDEDSHQVIDIRHTQVGKRNAEVKEAARQGIRDRDRNGKLEIIKGDQTVEERIAELKGKSDMASMAERVSLLRRKAKLSVVHDDSLGMGVGGKATSLNAGQPLPSREGDEERRADAEARAASLKAQVKRTRQAAGVDVPPEIESEDATMVGSSPGASADIEFDGDIESPLEAARELTRGSIASDNILDDSGAELEALEAQNDELREENAKLKATQNAILERLAALESASQPKKSGRPKGSADKAPRKPRTARKIGAATE